MEYVKSFFAERVLNMVYNYISQMFFKFRNQDQITAEDISKAYTMLSDLNYVLQRAEEKLSLDSTISGCCITDLADLKNDLEGIWEEMEYKYKQAQQQQTNRSGWSFLRVGLKRKRSEVPDKLEEISVRLNLMCERKNMLNLFIGNPSVQSPSVPSHRQIRALDSSISTEPTIYGREREMDEIVELLLEPNNGSERVGVIPVVGMGGIGKTTLAQHVLNNHRVVGCFEITVWVCVSMEYDKCRIYKRIIEAITLRGCDVQDECSIEDKVRSKLRNKKFLIILDDLWNEDMHAMNKLFVPFQFGAPNSKIVITTRNLEIANQLKTVNESIQLIGLSDEDCWSIFCSHVRLDTESPLVAIGKELSKKCAGNPLAAAVIGGLLRRNHNKESWMSVLNDASLISDSGMYEIMSVLKMSYDAMPDCLKPCFLCCTMFPEDYLFDKELIVQIWVSAGLISFGEKANKSTKELESLAKSYFDALVSRSLLSDYDGCGYDYVMHDLIREMGTKIPSNPYYRWENEVGSLQHVRYLTVHRSLIAQINYCLKNKNIVHSLPLRIFLPISKPMESNDDMDNFIRMARQLRVLSLQEMRFSKIPKSIGQMNHLRYLNISGMEALKEVPQEVGSLVNLTYLYIRNCKNVTTLPSEIGRLSKLTKLDMFGCTSLTTLPSEIGCLENLRELNIGYCPITKLPTEIGKLINLEYLNMQECRRLTTLSFEISCLRNLRHLVIINCGLTTLPSEIDNLTTLEIWGRISCLRIPL